MAYQEREAEHRRIVVDTPSGRREEIHSEARSYPERSGGVSGAALAAIVVGVIALAAIIILFVMNQQQNAVNANTTAQQQPQTIVQQPAQQPPVIVQQPASAPQQPPVIINGQPAPATSGGTSSSGATTANAPDDSTIQTAVDKKLSNDAALSSLGITATVANGKVTLMGVVHSAAEKSQVERAVRSIKGVKAVDNQISVSD
ncbi:MAG TPA: BON domain-containing protein [Pyrinomonadaceae bacterium]|jgi:osmotically-inducible protein OsmY|nr:BON domain-containing protein [Pyrinomonadaceae bacterium]